MQGDGVRNCYLKPGEFCVAIEPTIIRTVLGSCVSVTMYSRRTGFGAACHAMMPTWRKEGLDALPPMTSEELSRYVEGVIPLMLEQLQHQGVMAQELEVKLFGGADMMMRAMADHQRVGFLNIQKAKRMLSGMGITLANEDVGGGAGRQLVFDTRSGDVWVKRLKRTLSSMQHAIVMHG